MPYDCISKWDNLQEKDQGAEWTTREDAILLAMVRHLGTNHWNEIARNLNSLIFREEKRRTGKQCYNRWTKVLNVKENDRTQLPSYEKLNLCLIWIKVGNRWNEIAKLMGISEGRLKWCWKTMLKEKGIKAADFSQEGLKVAVKRIIEELKIELGKTGKKPAKRRSSNFKINPTELEKIEELNNLKEETPKEEKLNKFQSFGNEAGAYTQRKIETKNCEKIPRRKTGDFSNLALEDNKNLLLVSNKLKTEVYEILISELKNEEKCDNEAIMLCDISFNNNNRLSTESEDFDFSEGINEAEKEDESLEKIMKEKSFADKLKAKRWKSII